MTPSPFVIGVCLAFFALGGSAQSVSELRCDNVTKNHFGQKVTFYGRIVSLYGAHLHGDHSVRIVVVLECRAASDTVIPNGTFAFFAEHDSLVIRDSKRAINLERLLKVTGVVSDSMFVKHGGNGSIVPTLSDVTIELITPKAPSGRPIQTLVHAGSIAYTPPQ